MIKALIFSLSPPPLSSSRLWTGGAMNGLCARAASPDECTAPRVAGHAGHDVRQVLCARGRGIRSILPVPSSGNETPRTEGRYANTRQAGTVARFIERIDPDPSIGSHLLSGLSARRPSVPALPSFRLANPTPAGFSSVGGDQHHGPCHWWDARGRHLSRPQ